MSIIPAVLTCSLNEDYTVNSVSITSGGSGYISPIVEFGIPSQGGIQAEASVTIDANGSVVTVTLLFAGSGYINIPRVAVYESYGNYTPSPGITGFDTVPVNSDSNKYHVVGSQDLYPLFNAKAPIASPTFTGTVSGISKSMVGLGNVDNTTDANKPVSTATQTALDLKANLASPTFTGTVSGISKSMVGLGMLIIHRMSINPSLPHKQRLFLQQFPILLLPPPVP